MRQKKRKFTPSEEYSTKRSCKEMLAETHALQRLQFSNISQSVQTVFMKWCEFSSHEIAGKHHAIWSCCIDFKSIMVKQRNFELFSTLLSFVIRRLSQGNIQVSDEWALSVQTATRRFDFDWQILTHDRFQEFLVFILNNSNTVLQISVFYGIAFLYGAKNHDLVYNKHRFKEDWEFAEVKHSLTNPIRIKCDFSTVPAFARKWCVPLAVVIGKYYVDNPNLTTKERQQYLKNKYPRVRHAQALVSGSGIKPTDGPFNSKDCYKIQMFLGEHYQINCYTNNYDPPNSYGRHGAKQINLFFLKGSENLHGQYKDGHAYVITNMIGFLSPNNSGLEPPGFCQHCKKLFSVKRMHKCNESECNLCRQVDCVNRGGTKKFRDRIQCEKCLRPLYSKACLDAHKCNDSYALCKICHAVKHRKHVCGQQYCPNCTVEKPFDHKCIMNRGKCVKKPNKYSKCFYFDMETILDAQNGHQPRLIVVQSDDGKCEKVYEGRNCAAQFAYDLKCKDSLYQNSYLIAFNLAYDGLFVLRELQNTNLNLEPVCRGNRLLSFDMSTNNITFRDAMLFIPNTRLAALPKIFDLDGEAKGTFPYKLLRDEWLDRQVYKEKIDGVELRFPAKQWFDIPLKDTETFNKWWKQEAQRFKQDSSLVYNIKTQLKEYCRSDVRILRLAFTKFMKKCSDKFPGVEVLGKITMPSYENQVFRELYMVPESIALVPPQGYSETTSRECLVWLAYQRQSLNLKTLRHARNSTEIKIRQIKVDGFGKDHQDNLYVFQYHGCRYHGCCECYPCGVDGRDSEDDRGWTLHKDALLRDVAARSDSPYRPFTLITIWSCQWDKEQQNNQEIRAFVKRYSKSILAEPLNPRATMRGGKTSVFKHLNEATNGKRILYLDFTSLYPSINAGVHGELFPIGHPEILLGLEIEEKFASAADSIKNDSLFGLLRCELQPPKRLMHPIIGKSINSKLLFPLCLKCAVEENQSSCTHDKKDRRIDGTFTTVEVQEALKLGYQLGKVYEAWHWPEEQRTNTLFKPFIMDLYKDKEYASGFPPGVDTEEAKNEYAKTLSRTLGLDFDPTKFHKDSGRRALAKFMLNNFWGFFGKREDLETRKYVTSDEEINTIVNDDSREVVSIDLCGSRVAVVHKPKKEPMGTKTSVVLASFTTAYARLHLNRVLCQFPHEAAYADTDSVMLVLAEGQKGPEASGSFGELKDEILADYGPGAAIEKLYILAAKSYTKTIRLPCGRLVLPQVKMKGIRCGDLPDDILSTQVLRKMILDGHVATVPQKQFRYNLNDISIKTMYMKKKIGFSSTKRRILDDECLSTVPYGYIDDV